MKIFIELRKKFKKLLFPFIILFILVYTYYQMLTGDRGLMVWYDLNAQVEGTAKQNLALTEQVSLTDVKINRLKGKTLDPDYIDEQIRKDLSRMHPSETVIFLK